MSQHCETIEVVRKNWLDFLWIELTAKCNLRCVHCYADSGPEAGVRDVLNTQDYKRILTEASSLGCRQVQFIGGEPTVYPDLVDLIEFCKGVGFEFVEVYTNATHITNEVMDCFERNHVAVAFSFYSVDSRIHDGITQKIGSHSRVLVNVRRLLDRKIQVRAGIVAMDENRNDVGAATELLKEMGIFRIGVDHIRGIGRASIASRPSASDTTAELCGACWRGSLCIASDGTTAPCIMAKHLATGSVLKNGLSEIIASTRLDSVREKIRSEVWLPKTELRRSFGIHRSSAPCDPMCDPSCQPICNPRCSPTCSPQMSCQPYNQCDPELYCDP